MQDIRIAFFRVIARVHPLSDNSTAFERVQIKKGL